MMSEGMPQVAEPVPALTPIAYEQTGVSRRAFRWLMVLTLLNTTMLGMVVAGPTLTKLTREQVAAYQERRAWRAEEAKRVVVRQAYLPAQQQCLNYTLPAGTLVYAEDPAGIALLKRAPTNRISAGSSSSLAATFSLPVGIGDPPFTVAMPAGMVPNHSMSAVFGGQDRSLIFLHERHTTAGSRLVSVMISCGVDTGPWRRTSQGNGAENAILTTNRVFVATVMTPAASDADLKIVGDARFDFSAGHSLVSLDENSKWWIDSAGKVRLFAGEADAADGSAFHLPYDLDGHQGVIDVKLYPDERVVFTMDAYLAGLERETGEHPPVVPSPDVKTATGKVQ